MYLPFFFFKKLVKAYNRLMETLRGGYNNTKNEFHVYCKSTLKKKKKRKKLQVCIILVMNNIGHIWHKEKEMSFSKGCNT